MVSKILNSNNKYYCSNCHMRVFDLTRQNCLFCGNYFSNWESLAIKQFEEQQSQNIGDDKNESNLYGKN